MCSKVGLSYSIISYSVVPNGNEIWCWLRSQCGAGFKGRVKLQEVDRDATRRRQLRPVSTIHLALTFKRGWETARVFIPPSSLHFCSKNNVMSWCEATRTRQLSLPRAVWPLYVIDLANGSKRRNGCLQKQMRIKSRKLFFFQGSLN